jgi:hypothetical protein
MAGPSRLGGGGFAALDVAIPGNPFQARDGGVLAAERRVSKGRTESNAERVWRQGCGGLAFANVNHRGTFETSPVARLQNRGARVGAMKRIGDGMFAIARRNGWACAILTAPHQPGCTA